MAISPESSESSNSQEGIVYSSKDSTLASDGGAGETAVCGCAARKVGEDVAADEEGMSVADLLAIMSEIYRGRDNESGAVQCGCG